MTPKRTHNSLVSLPEDLRDAIRRDSQEDLAILFRAGVLSGLEAALLKEAAAQNAVAATSFLLTRLRESDLDKVDVLRAVAEGIEEAIDRGSKESFRLILSSGISFSGHRDWGWRKAAEKGRVEFLNIYHEVSAAYKEVPNTFVIGESLVEACKAGHAETVDWFLEHLPNSIKLNKLFFGARAALAAGHKEIALTLFERAAVWPGTDRWRTKGMESLFAAAAYQRDANVVQAVLARGFGAVEPLTRHAAISGDEGIFRDTVKACACRGLLEEKHLEGALMIAVSNGSSGIVEYLLELETDYTCFDNAPLYRAVDRFREDGFRLIHIFMESGADVEILLERFKERFPEEQEALSSLEKAAAESRRRAVEMLESVAGTPLTLKGMRRHYKELGTTGLHYAAKRRVLFGILDSIGTQDLKTDDFFIKDAKGCDVLMSIEANDGIRELFAPKYWVGKIDKATLLYERLAPGFEKDVDLPKMIYEADMLALRKALPPGKFSLKNGGTKKGGPTP